MRAAMLAAAMACVLVTGAQAVTFQLVNAVVVTAAPGARYLVPTFSIDVSQAAVERGSFSYAVLGGFGFTPTFGTQPTGDVADFGGLRFALDQVDPNSTGLHGQLRASITFGSDGTVTSSSFNLLGVFDDLTFSGPSSAFGGTYGGFSAGECSAIDGVPCRLTGQLVQVPEPASVALLAGLLGVAIVRRSHWLSFSQGRVGWRLC